MSRFKSLTIKNFLSYGAVPTIINLDEVGSTLILGRDLDNTTSGDGANGVGKTVIINALAYAVYDKPISKISLDNLVNNINKKNMEVTVVFEQDGITYTIKRFRKAKAGAAGNYVQLFEGTKDITPANVGNTNKKIVEIIGIPYDLFVRVAAFSATLTPFLDLPVRSHYEANQTGIIEELFDLTTLSEKAELLKKVIKDTEQSLEIQKTKVDMAKKEHNRLDAQIEAAVVRKSSWDVTNSGDISKLEKKLSKLDGVDIEHQQQLHTELSNVDEELNSQLALQRTAELSISKITKAKLKLEKELKHLDDAECPYCNQKYEDAEAKIKECKTDIIQFNLETSTLEEDLLELDHAVEESTSKRKVVSADITVSNMDELIKTKNEADHHHERIKELKTIVNPFIEPLQELEDTTIEEANMDKVNDLVDLITHQKFLLKLLTKKDSFVRKALLNKNIPFLNSRLSHYIIELGLPHVVEFTFEMTAKISQFGREMDFGNLSSGQRARVNLALSLAFRDVLQTLHESINICMFDEVLDVGLDTVGVQHAARILKQKARDEKLTLFIISHRADEIGNIFDKRMVVQLSKGFSNIVEE